jgi:SlyX protein
MKPVDERVNDLEVKVAFLEDLVDELNRTAFRQQQQIEVLVAQLAALREQVRGAAQPEFRSLRDEIPPHY